jgi:hypothetical protein
LLEQFILLIFILRHSHVLAILILLMSAVSHAEPSFFEVGGGRSVDMNQAWPYGPHFLQRSAEEAKESDDSDYGRAVFECLRGGLDFTKDDENVNLSRSCVGVIVSYTLLKLFTSHRLKLVRLRVTT